MNSIDMIEEFQLFCTYVDQKTIHEELVTALGQNTPSYTTVIRWAKRFRERGEDINDHP